MERGVEMIQENIKAEQAYKDMVKRLEGKDEIKRQAKLKKALDAFRKGEPSADYLEGAA